MNSVLSAGTDITVVPEPATGLDESDFDLSEMEDQLQHTLDLNGPFVANAFSLANLLGYPIGKSALGSFPHFEIGIAGGAGCTNMEYFDDDKPREDGTLPMFAPNPVIHFGLGLFGGLDVIGKMFYINKTVLDKVKSMDYESDIATIKNFKIYSVGSKIRYNYAKKKTILPFYLAFGGLTFSLGGNFMYGDINLIKEYEYDFEDIDIATVATTDVHFDGTFKGNIHWTIFSIDVQAVAYLDLFYVFSLYSGFGVAGNFGYFRLKIEGSGDMTSEVPGYENLGDLTFLSDNKYYSTPVTPFYIIGLEINIFALKIDLETMVNLYNRSDVNAQAGTRIQF